MPAIDSKFEQWQSRLLDLSKRNRLLFFKHVKRGNVQIVEPAYDAIFNWLVKDEKKLIFPQPTVAQPLRFDAEFPTQTAQKADEKLPLRPGDVRTNLNDQQLATTLHNIRLRARTAIEEQGVNILYLAFGMFEWYEADNSDEMVRSPLILVPVELVYPSVTKPYAVELLDEEILLNPTLAYKMQTDFRLSFPALPDDWGTMQLEDIFAQVREILKGQPRWSVSAEVHLGLFSFEKLVMLKDLASHTLDAKEHPLVAALSGDKSRLPPLPADLPLPEDLDARVPPEETFQVLDADSSQQTAIALAKRGVSFVIQGPPGTGKSQTIVNIIAECLAQGKKVLFVSEKMAALEVVYKRLSECDLDNFCLEAHSHKAKKSAIIGQLRKAFDLTLATSQDSFEANLHQVADLRNRLNRYASALHTEHTLLCRTPFQMHGQLVTLEQAPTLNFSIESIAQIDAERLGKMLAALGDIVALSEVWDHRETHLWQHTLVQVFSLDIRSHFSQLINSLDQLETVTAQLGETLGLERPSNWTEAEPFFRTIALAVDTPFPPEQWFRQANLVELRKSATEAQRIYSEYSASLSKLLTRNTEAILSFVDLEELVSRFETSYRSILRGLNANYRRDLQRIQSTTVGRQKIGYTQARKVLKLAVHIRETRQWIDVHTADHQQMFGRLFNGMDTQWDNLLKVLDWTESVTARFSDGSPRDKLIDVLCNKPVTINDTKKLVPPLQSLFEHTQRELAYLGTVFPTDEAQIEQTSFPSLKQGIQLLLDHLDDLQKWIAFKSACMELEQQGLGSFLQAAMTAKITGNQLRDAFLKRFCQLWLDTVYQQDQVLRGFDSDQYAGSITQFRKLDQEQLLIARKRITMHLAALRPKTSWVEAPSSEMMILRREIEKKKRHKPIRKLFAEIPNLLLTLKPCLMMSPLSVSQFLSSAHFEFDVVIFDEASQICPEDAISSVMRGKQIIVAGDKHQLPPTPFFRSLGIDFDEWADESTSESLESLLQECSVFLPDPMLKWHYRSRHEALIAFSNHHIYDDRLITFPNSHLTESGFGIAFVHVPDGSYDRGKSRQNRIEAKRVAELVFQHFDQSPGRSLGVVAFSEAQREAIDEELDLLLGDRPELEPFLNQEGPEVFFVKNLENVQGDERDVIFFSVGYGKDANAKMTMNFGPLNGEDGARRLNVAITRARYHVKLVSSILPSDIDPTHPNRGVHLLRSYMEYARQEGSRESLYTRADTHLNVEPKMQFETTVYEALTAHGLIVHKRVGRSDYRVDLAVVDPERPDHYLLGIESDGLTYHSAKTARDRDRLRQQVLKDLGWEIHRVWSHDWIVNPGAQVQKILDAVSRVRQSQEPAKDPPTDKRLATDMQNEPDLQNDSAKGATSRTPVVLPLPKGVAVYSYIQLPRQGDPAQFYVSSPNIIAQLLIQLVNQEGPIHTRTACRRIAACWGISRIGSNIESNIRRVAKQLASKNIIKMREDFLWPSNLAVVIVRQPPSGKPPRSIQEITIEEIAQAACLCLQNAFSLTRDDLIVQTAHLLGYDRTGEKVKKRIQIAIDRLIHDKSATVTNDKIELGAGLLK